MVHLVTVLDLVADQTEVFTYLWKIAKELDYTLVMVTNQDGLGTDRFPEETFWPTHDFLLKSFENEGVVFDEILIDRSFPEDNAPTRKPRTGMLTEYQNGKAYDLPHSFVIGDRLTDMELAKNLGAKGIYLSEDPELGADEIESSKQDIIDCIALTSRDWAEIYNKPGFENEW